MIENKYLDLISEDEARFILDHSEKQLKDILDTNLDLVGRTTNLIGIAFAVLAALVGYTLTKWETVGKLDELIITASIASIYLFIALTIVGKNISPKAYYTLGAEPEDFFIDKVFNKKNEEYRIIAILFNEIKQAQKRIIHNKKENEKKWANFRLAVRMLYFLPVFILLVYLIVSFLLWSGNHFHCLY